MKSESQKQEPKKQKGNKIEVEDAVALMGIIHDKNQKKNKKKETPQHKKK